MCGDSKSCAGNMNGSYCDSMASQCKCAQDVEACTQHQECVDDSCKGIVMYINKTKCMYTWSIEIQGWLVSTYFYCTGCNDWIQRDGYSVSEGHGTTNECYPTLEEAKSICLATPDCHAIASQNDTCGGQFRVSHGGPTLNYISTWKSLNLRAWVRTCGAGNNIVKI